MAKVSHFRYALRFYFTICCCLVYCLVQSQTLGGRAAYNFLSFSASTPLSAAGGINVSHNNADVSFALYNPALLKAELHGQVAMNFTDLVAGIKALNVSSSFYHQPSKTAFGGSLFFVHYGSLTQTDAAGNEEGTFNAYDYVVQVSAGKTYLERWQYGSSLKWIQSHYGPYNSSALSVDIGLLYKDTIHGLRIGFVAKNMGVQLKGFQTEKEDLPLDLQLGLTKKLLKAPLAFSVTAHQLHRISRLYNDTTLNRQYNMGQSNSFFKRTLNHFVLATHVYIGKHLEATVGYNVLRRSELSTGNAGNGLTGFSAGLSARFQKFQFHYARSSYQKGIGNNQVGISINLTEAGGLGKL